MHKHLGIFFSNNRSWHKHINYIKEKAWSRINIMGKLKFQLDRRSLETFYTSFIRAILGMVMKSGTTVEKIQKEAARIVTGTTKLVSSENLYGEIGLETLESRRKKQNTITFYKMINNLIPQYLSSLISATVSETSSYNLRNANDVRSINARTS